MQAFRVDDMACGHCIGPITKALQAGDKDAEVTVDLARHLVMAEPTEADAQDLRDALAEAGCTPVPVEAATALAQPATAGGGCCR